jgi:hypothetical protein
MTTISSRLTVIHKWVVPVFWFGMIVFIIGAVSADEDARRNPFLVVFPLLLAVFGFLLMKFLLWDLVDEVEDHGDYLVVRNRGEQERIPLSNITRVSGTMMVNPPRVTLRLAKAGKFGDQIVFTPVMRFRFNPFAKHPITEELSARVDRARRA